MHCRNGLTSIFVTMLIVFVSSSARADECASGRTDIPAVVAFERSEYVRAFAESYGGLEVKLSCTKMTPLSSICGAVGCSTEYLLTKEITTKGANPQTRVVMGMVQIDRTRPQALEPPTVTPVRFAPVDAVVVPYSPPNICQGGAGSETTAAIKACRQQAANAADQALVREIDDILAMFESRESADQDGAELNEKRLASFEGSQESWEIYRARACEAERLDTFPGSFSTIRRLDCYWRLTEARRQQIRLTYFAN